MQMLLKKNYFFQQNIQSYESKKYQHLFSISFIKRVTILSFFDLGFFTNILTNRRGDIKLLPTDKQKAVMYQPQNKVRKS